MWKWQRLFTGGEKDSSFIIEILILVSSVAQSYPTLCDPMNRSTPGLPVHHLLPEFTMPSSHFILGRPLLLLPSIPPSIRVCSNESTLCMRWTKYWSFSLSIIPSKEIPGLISFIMDWLDLLALGIKKQRHHFVNKGLYSQSYGFSSSHVWM